MKKVVINLSPQKENITSVVLQNLTSYTPLIGVLVVFVTVIILFLQMFICGQAYRYNAYNRKWNKLSSKHKSIRKIKDDLFSLEEEKASIAKVAAPEHDIVLIFNNIFSALPKNVWFEGLDFQEGKINLKGHIVKWGEDYLVSLDKFINSLREKKYFNSKFNIISIKESKQIIFNGMETVKFIIECKK